MPKSSPRPVPASKASTASNEAWLPGFSWALPRAFSGAVSACRFEQGDVLYRDAASYGDWRGGVPGAWIQVLDPPRSARAGGGADTGRFRASWGSPVELELDDGRGSPARRLATTQGRLFTCLWRSGLDALEAEAPPPVPLLLADLQRALEALLPALRRAHRADARALEAGSTRAAPGGAMLFVAAVDRAGDASIAKAEAIQSALAGHFEVSAYEASPAEIGLFDAERFHPPLRVRALRIEGGDAESITAVLKDALYAPAARARGRAAEGTGGGFDDEGGENEQTPAGGDSEVRSDRFSLSRHGLLVPLEAPGD